MMMLYGEENIECFKSIKPGCKLIIQETLVDFADKGKLTVATIESKITDAETGEAYAKILTCLVLRGLGGFGHKGTISVKYPSIPST
jgi:hypothetical protein